MGMIWKPEDVNLIPLGETFSYAGREMTVHSHYWTNGYDMGSDALVCDYQDNDGVVHEWYTRDFKLIDVLYKKWKAES